MNDFTSEIDNLIKMKNADYVIDIYGLKINPIYNLRSTELIIE